MSDQPDVLAALVRLERGQEVMTTALTTLRTDLTTEIATVRRDFLSELSTTRGQIMERLDHHQNRLESMFADIGVNWHNTDRVERKVDADREETRLLVTIVNDLTRAVRTLQSRITILEDKP